jgi:hypothetical protein
VFVVSLVQFLKNNRQIALTSEPLNSSPSLMFDMDTSEPPKP